MIPMGATLIIMAFLDILICLIKMGIFICEYETKISDIPLKSLFVVAYQFVGSILVLIFVINCFNNFTNL